MKTPLLYFILILLIAGDATSQGYEWALTANKQFRPYAVAIREDHFGNLFLASITDTLNHRMYSEIELRDSHQQIVWQKRITGNISLADMEITDNNHAIVVGYFQDSISIDNFNFNNNSGANTGLIFEMDNTGSVIWVHEINPVNGEFKPLDLFLSKNGLMYLTSDLNGGGSGSCAFHKLDNQGNIVQNKFPTFSSGIRTISHIIADTLGNIFVSGTCSSFATFDTISSNPDFAYQNFLVKYNNSFIAEWFVSKNYITFDNNNKLGTDGQQMLWAYNEMPDVNGDTVKVSKVEWNGTISSSFIGPLALSFFPGIDFSVDSSGNSILALEVFSRIFLYRFDPSFNLIWEDTLLTSNSGSPHYSGLIAYDSSFYLAAAYSTDSLVLDNFLLVNPNLLSLSASDLFICKWGYNQISTEIPSTEFSDGFTLYPNPTMNHLYFRNSQSKQIEFDDISIHDNSGRQLMHIHHPSTDYIDISDLKSGIYLLRYSANNKFFVRKFVKQ